MRYTPILSSYFHVLESVDISNIFFVFSFHDELFICITDYITDLFNGKIYSMDVLPTPLAMLLSFLAGPINLRKFITTRLLSSLSDPIRPEVDKSIPVRACW